MKYSVRVPFGSSLPQIQISKPIISNFPPALTNVFPIKWLAHIMIGRWWQTPNDVSILKASFLRDLKKTSLSILKGFNEPYVILSS